MALGSLRTTELDHPSKYPFSVLQPLSGTWVNQDHHPNGCSVAEKNIYGRVLRVYSWFAPNSGKPDSWYRCHCLCNAICGQRPKLFIEITWTENSATTGFQEIDKEDCQTKTLLKLVLQSIYIETNQLQASSKTYSCFSVLWQTFL